MMNTIQQTVIIPTDRRLRIDLALQGDIPTGQAEMPVVLFPTVYATDGRKKSRSVLRLAGRLADSAAFSGEPVDIQKAMRDEW
jgi:hypothetical protein